MPSRRLENAHHQALRGTRPSTARGELVILWIFPWMIGASLVLGGYLQYRHGQQLVALEDALGSVRLEAGRGRQATPDRPVTSSSP
jgi:hypothetical protein